MSRIVCFLCMLLVCSACERELKLPEVKGNRKIVLLGEFIAGDSISIRAGQSELLSDKSPSFINLLQGLSITVTDEDGLLIPLSGEEDQHSTFLGTLRFFNAKKIVSGSNYFINATHPALGNVRCPVSVPVPIDVAVTDTQSIWYAGVQSLATTISIKDNGSRENFYVIEMVKQPLVINAYFEYEGHWYNVIYDRFLYDSLRNEGMTPQMNFDTSYTENLLRVPLATDDQRTENLKFGNALTYYKRILLDDRTFKGGKTSVKFFADKAGLMTADNSRKGIVLLRIKSVSKEYFQYLRNYEQLSEQDGLSNVTKSIQLKGNVENGLGVIGGVNQMEQRFVFDTWQF